MDPPRRSEDKVQPISSNASTERRASNVERRDTRATASSLAQFPSYGLDPLTPANTPTDGIARQSTAPHLPTRVPIQDRTSTAQLGSSTRRRATWATRHRAESYVDPEYPKFESQSIEETDEPTWSLAKPLPRVVRPGMRKTNSRTDASFSSTRPHISDDVEAVPQIARTPGLDSESQRRSRENQRRHLELQGHNIEQGDMAPDAAPALDTVLSQPSRRSKTDAPAEHLEPIPENQRIDEEYVSTDSELEKTPRVVFEDDQLSFPNFWSKWRYKLRMPLAEFLGTFVAMTIGLCGSLSVTTSRQAAGTYQSANWAWGFGTMMGVYTAGGRSGAHLNPAVSLMLCITRGFPLRRVGIYAIAQFLGSITAAGTAFGIYVDSIRNFNDGQLLAEPGRGTGGGVIYTQPKEWLQPSAAFFNEFVASTILGVGILALGDDTNAPPGAGMHAFIIGLFSTVLSMAFGYNTNNCLNPVRDLGPRLVAQFAGYGASNVWTSARWWWLWGPWGADVLGTIFGGLLYDALCFTGPESPVNYPMERWKMGVGRRKRKSGRVKEKDKTLEGKIDEE